MGNTVIEIKDLTKVYKLYENPMDRLKEALGITKKVYHKEYYALNGINVEIKKGEMVGIIGTNGSGKSTLLKIITGVLNPSSGSVKVVGNISALLELGAGFNPEYTGLQNIYLNGTMLNKTKAEIDKEVQGIIDFADIGEFIHQPVKTYSSGMFVRLAFAVATNIRPDILVVDEALSVGDINFQMKSINRIKELMADGTTVLFVSHDIMTIKSLCNKAMYLDKGKMVAYGECGSICDLYLNNQNAKNGLVGQADESNKEDGEVTESRIINSVNVEPQFMEAIKLREGSGKARVTNVIVENKKGHRCKDFYYKDVVKVKVYFEVKEDIQNIVLALYLRNRNQLEVIGTNTKYESIEFKNLKSGSKYMVSFSFTNYLSEGEYGVSTILADNIPTTEFFDSIRNTVIINSNDLSGQKRWALVGIPMKLECTEIKY